MVVNSTYYYGAGAYTSWVIVPSNKPAPPPIAVGEFKFNQDLGVTFTDNQATYLRSGTVASVASYPQAATNDYSKAYGVAASSGLIFSDFATDGNLTIVGVYGSSNAFVSTDGGVTLGNVSLNSPVGQAHGVCWTGSRFIAAGHNNGITVGLSYSTNGTSWTSGGIVSHGGWACTGAAAIRHDGTTGIIAVGNGQNTCVFTTTDGSTMSGITFSGILPPSPRIAVMPSLGANRWLIAHSSSVVHAYRSNNAGGTSWSGSQTIPDFAIALCATADKFVIGRNNRLYYSSTGLSGSWTTTDKNVKNHFLGNVDAVNNGYLINAQNALFYDGTRLWVGNDIGPSAIAYANSVSYTTDLTTFASWTQVQGTVVFSGIPPASAAISPLIVGSSLLMIKTIGMTAGTGLGIATGGQSCVATNWASGPGYVGHSAPLTLRPDGTYSTTRYVGYIRVA
jgi:hypothetical protein